jgi:molybdenum cofactor cytidylyltransferase
MSRIAALILAAGNSSRMGTFKPLLPFGNRPMIARVVESLQSAATFAPILVITGHQSTALSAALADFNICTLWNKSAAVGGMLSSIHLGLKFLQPRADAVLLCLGDQPAVLPPTIQSLVHSYQQTSAPLVIPAFDSHRGHPILISAQLFPEILSLTPPQTLRDLIHRHLFSSTQLPVPDPAILTDIDTPEDYRRALAQWESRNSP